jgi:hypothetical protein
MHEPNKRLRISPRIKFHLQKCAHVFLVFVDFKSAIDKYDRRDLNAIKIVDDQLTKCRW